ncbi:MAG: hypothetical protein M1814_004287 [Vezdaea aestivalis]|nr:MAG: hypothetical protein M1814_004287 [Vezdaea aestivalis]
MANNRKANHGQCAPDYTVIYEKGQTDPKHWTSVIEWVESWVDTMSPCNRVDDIGYWQEFFAAYRCFDGHVQEGSCIPYVGQGLRRSLPGSLWKVLGRRQFPLGLSSDPGIDKHTGDHGPDTDVRAREASVAPRFYIYDPNNPPPDGNTNNGRRLLSSRFYIYDPNNPPPDGNTNNGRRLLAPRFYI